MNLVYSAPGNHPMPSVVSLTVPNEAVRGLRFEAGQWTLYVSDPEPMSVSKFRLGKDVLKLAADHFYRDFPPVKPLNPDQGEDLLRWLLAEKSVRVEMIASDGLPSMPTGFPRSGPAPILGMKVPEVTR